MTQFKKQIFSVITAGALLVNTAGTALAGTTIEISGNGAGSDNQVNVSQTNNTSVSQNNNAVVNNVVTSNANTGGNNANLNTGGDVHVTSGNATTTTDVTNNLNSNAAQTNCCATGNTDVLVKGNGAFSDNNVQLSNSNSNAISQNNNAYVTNVVTSNANTGGNKAGLNTGGDVHVKAGDASTTTTVKTLANSNTAVIGGGMGAMVTPTASFRILDNGAGSENNILASLGNTSAISQNNAAAVTNAVSSNANSGFNKADFNTGGDVFVTAGNAKSTVDVDTAVNFNFAASDCGCLTSNVLAKISGNGAGFGPLGSENNIQLTLGNANAIGQNNGAGLNNLVNDNLNTGGNKASFNVGESEGLSDPSVTSGNSVSNTSVSNSGNVNVVGGNPVWTLPNTNVGVSFNFAALFAFFGMSM